MSRTSCFVSLMRDAYSTFEAPTRGSSSSTPSYQGPHRCPSFGARRVASPGNAKSQAGHRGRDHGRYHPRDLRARPVEAARAVALDHAGEVVRLGEGVRLSDGEPDPAAQGRRRPVAVAQPQKERDPDVHRDVADVTDDSGGEGLILRDAEERPLRVGEREARVFT